MIVGLVKLAGLSIGERDPGSHCRRAGPLSARDARFPVVRDET